MPLAVRRTGEKIRVEAPLWAAGMAEASRERVGSGWRFGGLRQGFGRAGAEYVA